MNKIKDKAEFIRLLLVFAAVMAVMVIVSRVTGPWAASVGVDLPIIVVSLLLYVPMLAIVLIYSFVKGDKFLESFGIKKIKIGTVFLSILLAFVAMPMGWFANVLSQLFVPNVFAQAAESMFEGSLLPVFFAMAIMAPICEELLMRGCFQNRFSSNVLLFNVLCFL